MKFCIIFAEKLYAVHYPGDSVNVFRKVIEQWTDIEYLYNFLEQQSPDVNPEDIPELIMQITEDAHQIDIRLTQLAKSDTEKINQFFIPLSPNEYKLADLSKQKGRLRRSYTRVYGIKIEDNCFIITGGALKFTRTMQERKHTKKELNNLNKVREYLISEGIVDKEGFYELYNEQ